MIPDPDLESRQGGAPGSGTRDPLRVGILIDSLVQPRWIRRIVQDIQASSLARVVLVVRPAPAETGKASSFREGWRGPRHLLYRLYARLDDHWHARPDDPFQPASLEELVRDCEVLEIRPGRAPAGGEIGAEDLAGILGHDLDVFLFLGEGAPDECLSGTARYGVWSYRHGDGAAYPGAPAGFWEVMEAAPVTGSVLQRLARGGGAPEVLYRSFASTDWLSVRRSRNNYYWKSSAFVIRKLADLGERGPEALEPVEPSGTKAESRASAPSSPPGNLKMAGLMLRLAGRFARKKVRELLAREEWFLASSREAGIPNGAGLEYIFPPKDRYWADPFPVRWNGKTHVFLEEVPHETKRGHISVMTLQEDGRWGGPVKVLERDYHLSYPFLFRWENDWYLVPESAGNSTVELYRCVSFPAEWRLERVLLQGEKLYDVTLREIRGRWWMFASMAVGGALEWDELHLFHADSPLGPWRPHRRNPVKSDVRSSRPAGSLFEWQGSLCRPAQDCSRRYGYAISVNRILRIDTEEYREVEVSRILPGWDSSVLGVHTLNMLDGLTMMDCLRMRSRFR